MIPPAKRPKHGEPHMENIHCTFLASKAPMLLLDVPIEQRHKLFDNFIDMWDFLQNFSNLEHTSHGHWFCIGKMNSRKRLSFRYQEIYNCSKRYLYLDHAGITGYRRSTCINFCWEKQYMFFGMERTIIIINTTELFEILIQQIANTTTLVLTPVLLIVDYLIPENLFITSHKHPRVEAHNKYYFN